jgi:hypothetical protein
VIIVLLQLHHYRIQQAGCQHWYVRHALRAGHTTAMIATKAELAVLMIRRRLVGSRDKESREMTNYRAAQDCNRVRADYFKV